MAQAERLETTECIARLQLYRFRQIITQRHRHFVVVSLPFNRHGDHPQHRLKQTNRDATVFLPQVHHRDSSSVVGVVHAQVVLFHKALLYRQHPVHPGTRATRL